MLATLQHCGPSLPFSRGRGTEEERGEVAGCQCQRERKERDESLPLVSSAFLVEGRENMQHLPLVRGRGESREGYRGDQ